MGVLQSNLQTLHGKALVVDDSRLVRALIAGSLRKAGLDVDEAPDGAAALRMLEANPPDVVLTDLQMPELDGFGLIERLQTRTTPPEIILITSSQEQDVAIRALRLGAHDFLTKPLSGDVVVLTVARALEKRRLRETNVRLLRELELLSRTDGLTGVLNRRVFDEAVRQETVRATRYQFPLSLAMIDLDHFKKLNDESGHPGGDAILKAVGKLLRDGVRDSDQVFRYGGEEFAILLVHTDIDGAMDVCQRLRMRIAREVVPHNGQRLHVTASIGVASGGPDASTLVRLADEALYKAKHEGRNRVVASR